MTRTVDVVVAGDPTTAVDAAADAMRRGRRVLVVLPSADRRAARRVRRSLARIAGADGGRFTVMTDASVVCVEGVGGVEAVLIRYVRTGRLYAVNASTLVECDPPPTCVPTVTNS